MSCYFSIYMKKKDERACLFSYCSSDAREIRDEVNLKYGEFVPFSIELCNEIKDFYKDEIRLNEECKEKYSNHKKDLKEMAAKAQNFDIYNALIDEINECNKMMEFNDEENRRLEFRYHEFRVYANIMEEASYNNEIKFEYYYG